MSRPHPLRRRVTDVAVHAVHPSAPHLVRLCGVYGIVRRGAVRPTATPQEDVQRDAAARRSLGSSRLRATRAIETATPRSLLQVGNNQTLGASMWRGEQ